MVRCYLWVLLLLLLLAGWGRGHGRLRSASYTGVLVAGGSAETTLLGVHGRQAGLAGVRSRGVRVRDGGGAVGGGRRACCRREIGVALAFGTKAETLESRAHSIDSKGQVESERVGPARVKERR